MVQSENPSDREGIHYSRCIFFRWEFPYVGKRLIETNEGNVGLRPAWCLLWTVHSWARIRHSLHSHPRSPETFLQLLFYRNHNITHNQTLRYDRKLREHFNLREIGNFGACLYNCTRIIVKQFSVGLNEMNVSLLDIHSLLIILMCFRSCHCRRQSPPSTRGQSELGLVMIYISHSHLNSNHHHLQGIRWPPVVPTWREGAAQGCSPSVPALRWNMARGKRCWLRKSDREGLESCLQLHNKINDNCCGTTQTALSLGAKLSTKQTTFSWDENPSALHTCLWVPGNSLGIRKHPTALKRWDCSVVTREKIWIDWKGRLLGARVGLLFGNAGFF